MSNFATNAHDMLGIFISLRNKETQQTLRFIVSKQFDASFSANDINSWKQYVSVKLKPVQCDNRLSNHVGMRITSLTPVVNLLKNCQ